jgi:hypothetical protein
MSVAKTAITTSANGRRRPDPVLLHEQARAVVVVRHRHEAAQQAHGAHLVDVDGVAVALALVAQDLDGGGEQARAEEQEGERQVSSAAPRAR